MSKRKENKDELVKITKLKAVVDRIFTDTQEKRDEMTRYLKEYSGKWWNEKDLADHPHESKVFVNYIFSTAMSIAPLLTDNRPTWAIQARKPFLQRMYDLYSLCLKYLWDKLDMDMKTFKLVLDGLIMKNGVFKVHFNEKEPQPFGECDVDVVDPRVYFEAPGYEDNWDNPFQGTRERKPLSWIRENFPERGREVKPDEDENKKQWSEKEDYEVHNDFATVYEVWMRDSEIEDYYVEGPEGKEKKQKQKYPYGKIVVFTRDVLLNERPSKFRHNKPPYVKFYDYLMPHDSIGMGEADQIEALNRSVNRGFQLMDKFMVGYCDPSYLVDENAGIDVETVKATLFGGGNVYSYNSGINEQPIQHLQLGHIPSDLYQYLAALPDVIEEVSGATDITKGIASKTERQTAAEVSTLIESAYTRTRQRVRNLEHTLKRVCWLLVDLMQQFYTETRDFTIKTDDNIDFYKISNQQPFMKQVMEPKSEVPAERAKEEQDYQKYLEFIKDFGETDEVYAEFDLTIETNSTLPMDRQSLANLFLRLAQMKIIDPRAVIEQLRIPKGEEIIDRMEKMAQQAIQAKTGGQRPPRMPVQGQQPNMLQRGQEGI